MNRIDVRNPSKALDATGRKVIRLDELVVDRNKREDSSLGAL